MNKAQTVLITGAASGIGAAVAERFLEDGHTVIGIDIKPGTNEKLADFYVADITSEEEMSKIKASLEARGIRLDAILNIAGIHRMASLVEDDFETLERVVRVNLVGTMLVNRIFHSLLSPNGRILIVTSEVAGIDPLPFNGIYSISKCALDSYAQALRQELNLIGQRVITIRPGAIETPLQEGSISATEALAERTELYKKQAYKFSRIAKAFMGKPMKAEELARLIYKATAAKHPKVIYNKHRSPGLVLLGLLPKNWQCAIIKLLLK
jgi:NAD(P)-dependent dehydrogenase (short-subunit alcohol dehydrogenase family)